MTIKSVTRTTMQDFFLWVCEAHSITSRGTLEEYIRQFQQLYTTIAGRFADRNDIKELYKVHDVVELLEASLADAPAVSRQHPGPPLPATGA